MPAFKTGKIEETQYLGPFKAKSILDSIQSYSDRSLYAFYGHVNRPSKSRSIVSVTKGNPTVFTIPNHGMNPLGQISFHSIIGMTELANLTGETFTVSVLDENRVSIELDSTSFSNFSSGIVEIFDMNNECSELFNCSEETSANIWKNMLGIKRVNGNDVAMVIPRVNYSRGKVLNDWSFTQCFKNPVNDCDCETTEPVSGNSIYVTEAGNVYQCISNGGGSLSLIIPSQTTPYEFSTPDGYRWQFLFNVDLTSNKFVTDEWIPVTDLLVDNGTAQWDSIEAAEYSGKVVGVDIINPGSGYLNGVYTIPVNGDGNAATVEITVQNNAVSLVTVETQGYGYSWGDLVLSGSAFDVPATFRVNIEPTITFSKNSFISASVCRLMVFWDFLDTEDGKFLINNRYFSYGLLYSPREVDCEFASGAVYDLRTEVGISSPSQFIPNESLIISGRRLPLTEVTGSNNSTLKVLNAPPINMLTGTTVSGELSGVSNTISSITPPEILYGSGAIIVYEIMSTPIVRNQAQRERYKIILEI